MKRPLVLLLVIGLVAAFWVLLSLFFTLKDIQGIVIIGSTASPLEVYGAGSVYIYGTNGTLLATIPNPLPEREDGFGAAVAGLGPDTLVVSADEDDSSGVEDAGCLFLYSPVASRVITKVATITAMSQADTNAGNASAEAAFFSGTMAPPANAGAMFRLR